MSETKDRGAPGPSAPSHRRPAPEALGHANPSTEVIGVRPGPFGAVFESATFFVLPPSAPLAGYLSALVDHFEMNGSIIFISSSSLAYVEVDLLLAPD